ncbi:MAG: hypothetical protein KDB06_13015 [Ilumatobacter sp.]|nr:hypothetical protein [Ilumatobacter sp.]MCB0985563.1 hypothetical protein [Ilumatobacter sp.]
MPKPPAARLLEALVYAPIGLAVQVREDLPRLVADGKAELENRVRVARWVGEMAVHYGRRQMQEARAQRVAPAPAQAEPATTAPARPVPDEPFDGYHLLTAAELVPLLDRLPGAERDMVREYEQATRARRTVLAKLDALGH